MTSPAATDISLQNQLLLSPEEVARFHNDGYLAPLTAYSPQQMERLRPAIDEAVAADPPDHDAHHHNRHLDSALIWRLCTNHWIVDAVRAVLGNDLLLWRSNFFNKEAGGGEIPWHQDRNFWPLEPSIVVTAWLAIDPSSIENGCLQLAPGTHRQMVPHVPTPAGSVFPEMADTSDVDLTGRVDIQLEPGQFVLFNERTLHHSEPNNSDRRRLGLAARIVIPQVRMLNNDSPEHGMILVHGSDRLGFNQLRQPPG